VRAAETFEHELLVLLGNPQALVPDVDVRSIAHDLGADVDGPAIRE